MLWRVAWLACACVGTTAVDLAQDWVVETNAEAEARLGAAVAGDILSYALVHGGRIVVENVWGESFALRPVLLSGGVVALHAARENA